MGQDLADRIDILLIGILLNRHPILQNRNPWQHSLVQVKSVNVSATLKIDHEHIQDT